MANLFCVKDKVSHYYRWSRDLVAEVLLVTLLKKVLKSLFLTVQPKLVNKL